MQTQLSAKVFDPLGLLSPFTITMKCEFQSLCVEKLDWDIELQGYHQRLWKNFVSSLIQLNNVRVPRCYFNSSTVPPTYKFMPLVMHRREPMRLLFICDQSMKMDM